MTLGRGRSRVAVFVAPALLVVLPWIVPAPRAALPTRLSGQEFWTLVESASEPNGYFRSDNLVSDEAVFAEVVPDLLRRPRTRGVYLGVGPEQNFSYIAALEPPMAFVIDIRRGNLHLQLLYKALFELSADRAEFISRLFVKPRLSSLPRAASADDLMTAIWSVHSNPRPAFDAAVREVMDVLVSKDGIPLSADDRRGIEYVYHSLYWHGPSITWQSSAGAGPGTLPSFAALVRQVDADGHELSFLATEARFSFVKDLEARNLIVPVVGNFAGPKAVRAVGRYLRDRAATVGAFYVSEVEAYLLNDGIWPAFCANLAALPIDDGSVLIRPPLSAFGVPSATAGGSPSLYAALLAHETALVPISGEVSACRAPGDRAGDPGRR